MSILAVWLTSPQPGNDRLAAMLRDRGVTAWQMPLLQYAPPEDGYAALAAAIDELSSYTHVVFASPHAVAIFYEHLQGHGNVATSHLKFAVVGESTAKLCAEYGFTVHYIPSAPTAQALGELMAVQVPAGSRVLFPQAEEGRTELSAAITRAKLSLTVVPAYRTIPTDVDVPLWQQRMTHETWQGVAVTSPKGLKTWLDRFGHAWCHEMMEERIVYVMGATTKDTATHLGFRRIISPAHSTLESLADIISSR